MLKDICANRRRGNPESRAVFNKIQNHIAAHEAEVLAVLARYREGLTAEQIEETLHLKRSSVSARISELKRRGLVGLKWIGVGKDGRPLYERRKTRSGSSAAVVVSVLVA